MNIRAVVVRTDRKTPKYSFYQGNKSGREKWGGPKKMFFFSSLLEAKKFALSNQNFCVFIAE